MLVIIASGLIFTECKEKTLSQFVLQLWNEWELRVLVLISLSLQFLLLLLGNRQKYYVTSWHAFFLWSAYLLADLVAIISLNTLFSDQGDCLFYQNYPKKLLMIFWAPFLLLHLGGQDTINAYALEDNEIWLRLLPGLVYQVGIVLYVMFKCPGFTHLPLEAFPIFIAGIVKYVERIWTRWSASAEHRRSSILLPLRPNLDEPTTDEPEDLNSYLEGKGIIDEAKYLHEAFLSFKVFTPLFAGFALRVEKEQSTFFTPDLTLLSAKVFKRVETELGFVYDTLYTKATIVHTRCGLIFRSICFVSTVSALVAFTINNHNHTYIDKVITYLLLVGAVVLEVSAFILIAFSNWTILWVTKHEKNLVDFVYRAIVSLKCEGKSKFMAQHNLIRSSHKARGAMALAMAVGFDKYLNTYIILAKYCHTSKMRIDENLEHLIYSQIKEKHERYANKQFDYRFLKDHILAERGDRVLKENHVSNDLSWSVNVPFDHSLLLWHIATDLCYYVDKADDNNLNSKCKMSKALSDYMLYLLVECSFLMPEGMSLVRYRDTCNEIVRFFHHLHSPRHSRKFTTLVSELLELRDDVESNLPGYLRSKSVLLDGIKLARHLQRLGESDGWDHNKKWKMISEVWVEMLTYAASQCGWQAHAKQLMQGKELLTQVCLLMAHHGLNEQIRIERLPEYLRSDLPPWNWDKPDNFAYYVA